MSLKAEFAEWAQTLPLEITSDALWHCTAYRLALFVTDRSWDDLGKLAADPRSAHMADQLGRSLSSISANYIEAYSRSGANDRCRFYEYSLSSTRESRDWSFKARHILGEIRTRESLELLTRIAQLLTVTIVRERGKNKRPRKKPRTDDA